MLKDLKIGTKLFAGFGIAVLSLIVLLIFSIVNLSSLNDEIDDLAHDKFVKVVWANNIIDAVNNEARAIRNIALTDDLTEKENTKRRMQQDSQTVNENYDKLEEKITN